MEKKYTKLIMTIAVVLIIIIILIILLILKINKNNYSNQTQVSQGDAGLENDFSTSTLETVTEKIDYYTVRNCINMYLNFLNTDSSIYYIGGESNLDIQKEYIYDILSIEYLEKNNISKENLLNKIDMINEEVIYVPLQMKVIRKENVNKFLTYGIIQTLSNYEFIKDVYFIVNLDYINKTFSIEPIDMEYNNIEDIFIENANISIEKNDNNLYSNQKITNEYVTKEYFNLYKRLSLSNPEIVYNMMSDDYKNNRFDNFEKFKQYINNNIDEILKINLKQYLVNNYDDYIEYVGKDQFGNIYIFNEYEDKSIEMKLDTYTIDTEKFINEYQNASDEKKVQMNVDKFIQMINRHDYDTSYKCISEGFKNNYFPSQQYFENYIKNVFYEYNKFEFRNIEKKGTNIYVANVNITDLTEENTDIREINIIMQLNENLEFEMSFGV